LLAEIFNNRHGIVTITKEIILEKIIELVLPPAAEPETD
jgi:hypothetical protein